MDFYGMGILGLILLSSSIVQQFSLQAIRSSVHNRAHVRLGFKKIKYKNPFSYLHFPSRTRSVQSVFFPIFKCPSNRTRSKTNLQRNLSAILTGRPGGLGPRCDEKIARNVKITLFSPHWMGWTTQNGKIRGKEKNREKNPPFQQQTEVLIYSFFTAFAEPRKNKTEDVIIHKA